jgi:glycosyltransferase involved in cell wall biosynthesis
MTSELLNIAVVIASLGRPQNIATLLDCLAGQTHLPVQVIISMEGIDDAPPRSEYPFQIKEIFGSRGSCVQRNRGLNNLSSNVDIVIFYDDDFVPSRFALAGVSNFFRDQQGVAGAHGLVLQDGICGIGISPNDARKIVDEADSRYVIRPSRILSAVEGLYGCNMAYRTSSVKDVRFDENLPLYGWLEDLDFGARIQGQLVHTDAFYGVHCGEKRGRETSGKRLGYSQVANPIYMRRKGTLSHRVAYTQLIRNVLANHSKIFFSEPWVDRRGRLIGNWCAFHDLVRGRIFPGKILEF